MDKKLEKKDKFAIEGLGGKKTLKGEIEVRGDRKSVV